MNLDTPENYGQDDKNFQNTNTGNQVQQKASSPTRHPFTDNAKSDPNYDSENLDNESDSKSKDITEQDIELDLINYDPSEGFETDITAEGDKTESGTFETIEPDQDNPVNKEFEIGELGNEELKEDEITRDETGNGALRNNKPSQRKF